MSGKVVPIHSTTGSLSYGSGGRPSNLGRGSGSSRNGTYAGVAPGRRHREHIDRRVPPQPRHRSRDHRGGGLGRLTVGGRRRRLNASIGQDTATGSEEARRYFDSIVGEDGRLVVAASGNFTTFGNWDVVSPGTGYNV